MIFTYLSRIVITILTCFTLFISCTSSDSKESMFMSDYKHTGKIDSKPVSSNPHTLWRVKTEGQVISSPVVSGNVLYIGSEDGLLYAINSLTGNIEWTFETNGPINSTPAIFKNKIMFLSYDGKFYTLNKSNGKLLWSFETGGESRHLIKDYFTGEFSPDFWDFYLSSPTVKNGVVYFGSSDSTVYALDINNGEIVWRSQLEYRIHTSPAIYDSLLFVGDWGSNIYCLDISNGNQVWSYTTGRDTTTYIWLGIQSSPTVDENAIYIGSRDGKVYSFKKGTGEILWTQDKESTSWMPSTAAYDEENIYCGSSDSFSFFSINKKDGEINYSTKTGAYTFSSPSIDNEMAYIGSANGKLYCIDLNNGAVHWEFETIGYKTDTLRFFNDDGIDQERLAILAENVKTMSDIDKLYNEVFVSTGAILSSPTINNQVVYFGSCDGYVYAISDK